MDVALEITENLSLYTDSRTSSTKGTGLGLRGDKLIVGVASFVSFMARVRRSRRWPGVAGGEGV